jgi:hypothetical protein
MRGITLAHAGCDAGVARKLEMIRGLATTGRCQNLRVKFWDGIGCDLVVVNPKDGFGDRALEIARRHGIPALLLGDPGGQSNTGPSLTAEMSAFHFYEAIEAKLSEAEPSQAPAEEHSTLWSELTQNHPFVSVRHGVYEVWVNRLDGYCIARTRRAAAAVKNAFREGASFEVEQVEKISNEGGAGDRTSIEDFFFKALSGRSDLPEQTDFRFALTSWPDIRCDEPKLTEQITSLSAKALTLCNTSELYERHEHSLVNAFVLSCRIAGLTDETRAEATGDPASASDTSDTHKSSGIKAALGRWLGLT